MKFHKRQLILASLVIALGSAVYLNWQFSDNKDLDSTNILESTKELGEARYVNATHTHEKNAEKSVAVAAISEDAKKYFAQAESNRQKSREETEEKLKNLSSDPNINSEVKSEIIRQIEDLSKNIQQETNIENLVKAKGFGECLTSIQNNECSIIVSPGNLNENTAVVIKDIITGQSGISYDRIKIVEAK